MNQPERSMQMHRAEQNGMSNIPNNFNLKGKESKQKQFLNI